MKVLIVDDEKLLVKGMKFNFEQDGYEVETAFDGEEALKAARDSKMCIRDRPEKALQSIGSTIR